MPEQISGGAKALFEPLSLLFVFGSATRSENLALARTMQCDICMSLLFVHSNRYTTQSGLDRTVG